MAGQITQEHLNVFQKLLSTVDNAGSRALFSHVLDMLKETIGVVEPVIEAVVPESTPVIQAVNRAGNLALMTAEELAAQIQTLQNALAAKVAAERQSQQPPATSA